MQPRTATGRRRLTGTVLALCAVILAALLAAGCVLLAEPTHAAPATAQTPR